MSALCKRDETAKRFLEVPGVGPMRASMVASDIGGGKGYESSRDYVASLGVVPKQHSSGGKLTTIDDNNRSDRYF